MLNNEFLLTLQSIQAQVEKSRNAINQLSSEDSKGKKSRQVKPIQSNEVEAALRNLNESLGMSYRQARTDLEEDRITWVSVAHEIREVLRQILDILAPDEIVLTQSWYKQEANTKGPTQKQKALYVLRQRKAGSKEEEMIKKIGLVEELISELVRDTYTRASVAAHGQKDRKEAQRLIKYFDAFAHDLLDL